MNKRTSLTARGSRYFVGIDDGYIICSTLAAALETINIFRTMFFDIKRGVLK